MGCSSPVSIKVNLFIHYAAVALDKVNYRDRHEVNIYSTNHSSSYLSVLIPQSRADASALCALTRFEFSVVFKGCNVWDKRGGGSDLDPVPDLTDCLQYRRLLNNHPVSGRISSSRKMHK
jgi:hypothetical protein